MEHEETLQGTNLLLKKSIHQGLFIKNVRLYGYGEHGILGNVVVKNGRMEILKKLEASLFSDGEFFDARNEYVLMPGWLDAHVHGFGGHDFSDSTPETLPKITNALGETGLSYCMATLISSEISKLKKTLAAIDAYVVAENLKPTRGSTQIVGVHLEGPFIAKNCKGAHDETVLQTKIDIELFKEMLRAAPNISQWKITLAPELEGAIEFIQQVQHLELDGRKLSLKIFIGHTNAREEEISAAVDAGAIGFTHLGNACGEEFHRSEDPHLIKHLKSNVVHWVIKNAKKYGSFVELIVDGNHLSQAFVNMIRDKVGDKILTVTDALGPSGLNDGEYKLGNLSILKSGEKFFLKNHPEKLAGSAANFASVIHKFGAWSGYSGHALMESIYSASVRNPRESSLHPSFNLSDDKNFVLLDKKGEWVMSLCNGEIKNKVG